MSKSLASFLIPVIALAVFSAAIAMWYDVLKVHGTIETGSVDVTFDGKPVAREEQEYDKDWVASCTAELKETENEDVGNPTGDNDLDLVIIISNAYPCYPCKVNSVSVKNFGTIPVKLAAEVRINGTLCDLTYNRGANRWEYVCDYDNDDKPEITVYGSITSLVKPEPYQLHPGEEKGFSVDTHVEQDAEEGKTYVIQILIKAVQWNEYE